MTITKRLKKYFKPKGIQIALKFKRYNLEDAILIFSEARGGSSWLMELLKNKDGVIINWEPLHVNKGVVPKVFKLGWRPYIPADNTDARYISLFNNIVCFKFFNVWTTRFVSWQDFKNSKHVLTKFVRANPSLPWVVNTFSNLKFLPIFLLRHPITVCISRLKTFDKITSKEIKSLKNDASFSVPDCINNDRFIEYQEFVNSLNSQFEVEIAIWCINNANIISHTDQDKWYTVYYEDLVLHPKQTFQALLAGTNIEMPIELIENIDYRKQSFSNFHGDLKSNPIDQLESFLNYFSKDELQSIQEIFDYFNLKVYSAFNAYPIK